MLVLTQMSNLINRDFKLLVPKESRKVLYPKYSHPSAKSHSMLWEKSHVFKGRNHLLSTIVTLETSPVLGTLSMILK